VTTVATAPGKIVLAGEYAVLSGAPAVAMAVQARARVSVAPSPDGDCHVTTPGFSGTAPFAVVDAVCAETRPSNSIELDTRAFSVDGNKIGIGSSAAVTVALVAALNKSTDVFSAALEAHDELQGGRGSGIDVAAAVHGGLIEYEMTTRSVRPMSWPSGLAMRVLWTGVSASTEARLQKLAAQTKHPSHKELELAAGRMAAAWRSGDADSVLTEFADYIGVLRQFSIDHDLDIFDAGHDALTDAAMASNLVYKPAGAGGGDIGILLGSDATDLDDFVDGHSHLTQGVVPCELDPDGVRLERT